VELSLFLKVFSTLYLVDDRLFSEFRPKSRHETQTLINHVQATKFHERSLQTKDITLLYDDSLVFVDLL